MPFIFKACTWIGSALLFVYSAECAPAIPTVTLLQPGDPDFRTTLTKSFPGFAQLKGFPLMKAYIALVINGGAEEKLAYSVRWRVSYDSGQIQFIENQVYEKDNALLRSGEPRLVSPVFSLSPSEYGRDPRWPELLSASFPSSSGAKSIYVVLDSVIGRDGKTIGRDVTQLGLKAACMAKAVVDEGALISNLLEQGKPLSDIQAVLNEQTMAGLAGPTGFHGGVPVDLPASLLTIDLGQEAQTLRNLIQNNGLKGLRTRVAAMKNRVRPTDTPCVFPQLLLQNPR